MMTENLTLSLHTIQHRLRQAEQAAQRPAHSVQLLAVSKTVSADRLRQAFAAGQTAFGENYVQEWLDKQQALADLAIEWHFIGPLQSNKTRHVAELASWIHSVDRLKIAQRLSEQRPAVLPPLNVCLQVNVSGEASKSGVDPAQTLALAQAIAALPKLRLRGLMCIPEATTDESALAAQFHCLQQLFVELQQQGLTFDTHSMGMSADIELAVAHGSTMVRVGSALFGARPSSQREG